MISFIAPILLLAGLASAQTAPQWGQVGTTVAIEGLLLTRLKHSAVVLAGQDRRPAHLDGPALRTARTTPNVFLEVVVVEVLQRSAEVLGVHLRLPPLADPQHSHQDIRSFVLLSVVSSLRQIR